MPRTPPRPNSGAATAPRSRLLRLRHVLFFCLLLSGIIPLAISSVLLIRQNRNFLIDQEMGHLVRSAETVSRQVDTHLRGLNRQLVQHGTGLLTVPGPEVLEERLSTEWAAGYLSQLQAANADLLALRVLDEEGSGVWFGPEAQPPEMKEALDAAFDRAVVERETVYGLTVDPRSNEPRAVVAAVIPDDSSSLVMESVNRLRLAEMVAGSGLERGGTILLVDAGGSLLWSDDPGGVMEAAVAESELLTDFGSSPPNFTRRFDARLDERQRSVQATVSRVGASGWGVVVVKPLTIAFAMVDRMIYFTLLLALLLVALAAAFAAAVSRWVGRPINRLTETSHEIAAGNFSRRVDPAGLVFEMSDLAADFNRMSEHVERYIEQLRRAANANRELFIGSIRAFAAAIDAKDPYTRGHSERVAAASRAIARSLGLDEEFQQRVWLGALLHDVGKIGVDDRILKKGGLLTPDEFEQMKLHTVIGAQIMERIGQLKEIVPAIRWHHENWNGRGYPDGIKGEQIPLAARIVAVADTFDAVTTNRPYQEAFTLEYAVETITRLAGARFDAKVVTAFLKAVRNGEIEVAHVPRPEAAPTPATGPRPVRQPAAAAHN